MSSSEDLGRAARPERSERRRALRRALQLVRMDAARWVRPQEFAEVGEVTPTVMARLLVHHQALRAVVWLRIGTLCMDVGVRGMPGVIQRRLLRLYGIELMPGAVIGGGLYVAHPVGCVLVAESIGTNVTIIGQATFGTRDDALWPTIGARVFVGVGARVLGGIRVGDDARIGSNAVVVHDVRAGATVVGVPAREVGPAEGASR